MAEGEISFKGRISERERRNLAILEALRKKGPIARGEISKITGLNIVTVSNYVQHYIKEGLVVEKGMDISTGGRKPGLIGLNFKAGYVVGIDLGTMDLPQVNMTAVLTDLATNVIKKVRSERPKEEMEKVISRSSDLIDETIKKSQVELKKIRGIGIGIAGVIDMRAGTVRDTSRDGTTSSFLSLKNAVEQKYGIPAYVGNDATYAAFGETKVGLATEVENMIYMYSDVGCGLIINGEIYYGITGSAGELGLNLVEEDLTWTKSLPFFKLGSVDLGIPDQARKLLEQGVSSNISELVRGDLNKISIDTVIEAAKDGDKLAMDLLENAGINLGIRIAYLVNLINPEVVVIGGGVERAGSLFLDPIRKTVRRHAFEEASSTVRIVPSQLGEDAVALGAASIVIREVFAQA